VTKATVSLVNLSHTFPEDIEILLVAPNNQTVLLMSHAGGGNAISNVNLTFDSTAGGALSSSSKIVSGTYFPTNYGDSSSLPDPAPVAPYGTTFNSLAGINPNGPWSLYVFDSAAGDFGSISGGWKLTLTTSTFDCCSGDAAPMISSIADQSTSEDVAAQVTFNVSDSTTPASSLLVTGHSSNPNLVPDANLVFSGTGTNRTLAVTPSENEFGTALITVTASDGSSQTSTSFLLTVNSVNDAPVLNSISPKDADEGTLLQFNNAAFDVENDQLTFTLDAGAPAGAAVDPMTGVFTWIPSEQQGPGVYTITLRVTDHGVPPLADLKKFNVTVNEVNSAPRLVPPTNSVVYAGASILFTNTASDADLPANLLEFSFEAAPGGAQLKPASGIFTWVPATNQLGTNYFTIRVTDDGAPNLSDAQTFSILVVPPPTIRIEIAANGEITLTWDAIPGRSYRVQYKNDLNQASWESLRADVTAAESFASKTDSSGFSDQRYYRILVLP
ncbi:MAG: Ig-like domain-containing protein, partial [Verrucomicrobiota bacterium]